MVMALAKPAWFDQSGAFCTYELQKLTVAPLGILQAPSLVHWLICDHSGIGLKYNRILCSIVGPAILLQCELVCEVVYV
jgi:hypothetical protein